MNPLADVPREVHNYAELQAAADAYAATPAARAEHTYLGRIAQMVAALREQNAIVPSTTMATKTARRRAAKWLSRAFGHIPRPHMEAAHGDWWLTILVSRIRALEGELYKRTRGLQFDAEPLPEEVRILARSSAKFKRNHAPDMLFIPRDWDGEPTCPGDYCIEALLEVLDDGRGNAVHLGEPDSGGETAGILRHPQEHGLCLAPQGAADRDTGHEPPGVLAP